MSIIDRCAFAIREFKRSTPLYDGQASLCMTEDERRELVKELSVMRDPGDMDKLKFMGLPVRVTKAGGCKVMA